MSSRAKRHPFGAACMEVRLCVGQHLITFALASYRTQGKQDWFSLRSLRSYIVRR